ncbi:SRPBCC family protein [Deinococcus rubellus]|uniref:SRPBCC family protein n=1 Tax=Deinococcus rubellus TaxID=1889240 RepID=A0ABY5YM05_9DEIO|nr:SRPBCC family protein [Deinococcus rubellus]UWX65289.1 SRPBCC family protein [Deinococcus rubellus]
MTNQESRGAVFQPTEKWTLVALGTGLAALGLRGGLTHKLGIGRLALTGTGAGLVAVALRGTNPLGTALKIRENTQGETLVSDAVTVGQPPEALYAVWRRLENLPALMSHLQEVRVLEGGRSRWTVKGPLGDVSWDAELTADEPGKRLAWRSLPGADIENSGEVLFRPAPGERGTEVVVRLKYRAPGSTVGPVIARMLGQEPSQQLRDDLMRFKREQELGFHPTTQGQSSGRAKAPANGGVK